MLSLRIRSYLAALLAVALWAAPSAAQGPEAGSELRVVLLTMGQGDQVWEKFGHNALWIHDPVQGTDRVYNYGVFDFDSPGYWSRFIQGNWLYQLAVDDIDRTLYAYQYFNRTVVAQELNLTPAQKREMQAFLEWNARPENREYNYDYYRDNCSTRIRDVIDAAIAGRLRTATEGEPTGTTYRWHSYRLLARDEAAYTGLAAGLGPAADRPISAWEEMFLPEKLMQRVREVRVEIDGRSEPLVLSERSLYEAVDRAPEPTAPPRLLPVFLLIGVAVGGALAALGRVVPRSGLARFGFSAVTALWALVVGTGGLLLVGLWAGTDHSIAYRNENLFLLDPLALPLALLVPALAYGARWAARPARWLALAAAGVALLGFVLQVLPGLDQGNGEMIALLLPVHLGLAWAVHRLSGRAAAPGAGAAPADAPPAPPFRKARAH